jgi:hypothetical protein
MKTINKIAAAVGALALIAGTASAGRIEGGDRGVSSTLHIDVDINHNFGSSSFVKSLLITVLDPFTGEVNPAVTILSIPAPTVKVFGTNVDRPVLSTELLELPEGKAVRWTFADDSLWSQGERLVFGFDVSFPFTALSYTIGEDYTFVPTPGAAAMFAGVGVLGMARRRR